MSMKPNIVHTFTNIHNIECYAFEMVFFGGRWFFFYSVVHKLKWICGVQSVYSNMCFLVLVATDFGGMRFFLLYLSFSENGIRHINGTCFVLDTHTRTAPEQWVTQSVSIIYGRMRWRYTRDDIWFHYIRICQSALFRQHNSRI